MLACDTIYQIKVMQLKSHLELHNEHLLWKSDLNMWSRDLEIWEKEMSELLDNLRIIEKAVNQHVDTYKKHQNSISEHELDINKNELDLSLLVEGSEYDERLNAEHQIQSQHHLLQKEAHQRLKQYHYTMAGLISQLRRSLENNE
jgi:hypothetical protein